MDCPKTFEFDSDTLCLNENTTNIVGQCFYQECPDPAKENLNFWQRLVIFWKGLF